MLKIVGLENRIKELNGIIGSTVIDEEKLAKSYKERGDCYIDLYINTYATHGKVTERYADESFADYKSATRFFDRIHYGRDAIYSTMALGNALKEKFLPTMSRSVFDELEKTARDTYGECVKRCRDVRDLDAHTQDYHFAMLEQINLMVRRNVWAKELRPKRVVVLHSLESPKSHINLEGICYFAYKWDLEIWEYRFGRVMTMDDPRKFIKDRLDDACAVVFLASKDYSPKKEIIDFEIKTVFEMKKGNDPISVFAIDLGNQELVKNLEEIGQVISADDIEKVFSQYYDVVKDIYECRRFRCNSLIV